MCAYIRDVLGNVEVMQLDFEMENFTSLSVTRRINWNIDYKGQGPSVDSEKVVTELTVVQRDIQAILPLAMVSAWSKEVSIRRVSLGRGLCKFMVPDRLFLFALFVCFCFRAFKTYHGLSINSHNAS